MPLRSFSKSFLDNTDSEITWTPTGNTNIIISIVNGIATFSAPTDWNGQETVTFTACDLELLCDSYTIKVTVNSVNDAPIVTNIPDLTITEDSVVSLIDLSIFNFIRI